MCFLWFYEHVFECFCQRITRNYRNNVLTKWPCFLIKSRKYFKIQIHQNNFQHKYVQYMQEEVLARGATTSSIFLGGEIYLKYPQNTNIFNIVMKRHVVVCVRYV